MYMTIDSRHTFLVCTGSFDSSSRQKVCVCRVEGVISMQCHYLPCTRHIASIDKEYNKK